MKNFVKSFVGVLFAIIYFTFTNSAVAKEDSPRWWSVQSIDTVKYSRDVAREKENDISFDSVIEAQVEAIANSGATHVAIGTPYDEEFIPYLKRWVKYTRKHGLNVWFRGNFSGWEKWFGYKEISRTTHLALLKEFITTNGDLFENGDIFTACPECENGGPGDPRHSTNVSEFRTFLIDQYRTARDAFRLTGKNVMTNYFPMNGDVARLIMDRETTKALGGIVVIDHYVATGQILANDIKQIAKSSGGKVILGEFGAPIPDIHGNLNEDEQAAWIESALHELVQLDDLVGINYWTNVGGSTEIWDTSLQAKKAVGVLTKYFLPKTFKGVIVNEAGGKIEGVVLASNEKSVISDNRGNFSLPFVDKNEPISISVDGYFSQTYLAQDSTGARVVMVRQKESIFFLIQKFFFNLLFS